MSLNPFNKELLEFLYALTLQKRILTAKQAGPLAGVSDRTARRWFSFLRKQCFDYYNYIDSRSIGLEYHEVLLFNVKNEQIYSIIPHRTYLMKCIDLAGLKPFTQISYWIPKESMAEFEMFWRAVEKTGLASCKVMHLEPRAIYYSPFHKTLSSAGINHDYADADYGFFSKILADRKEKQVFEPLLIPLIFESFLENWNARIIWFNIKQKIKGKEKAYFGRQSDAPDEIKINIIREKLNYLCDNYEKFIRQADIDYAPFNSDGFITVLLYFKCNSDIAKLAEKTACHTTRLYVRKSEKITSFYFMTDALGFNKILLDLAGAGCSNMHVSIKNSGATSHYYKKRKIKFPYNDIFIPETCGWKFELNKYLHELEKLS
ncbi:MAG TPA: hypothetical protein HA224_00655 [Nanoarchaeota archaeon]|nr:hypothetical protein [Nanoarchaeota archaeon]